MSVSRLKASVGYGVTANIAASHAAARGSIPRIRVNFFIGHPLFHHFLSSSFMREKCPII